MRRIQSNSISGIWLVVLVLPWVASAQVQEAVLRWKNGDVLVGRLLESESSQIRWLSPLFSEALVVDSNALESITFLTETLEPVEALRVATVAGDVFAGDLVASDENTLHFTSKRYGRILVNRDAVYSLTRRIHPNLIFDGSQITDWDVALPGPVKDSTYQVYTGGWAESDDEGFPKFSRLSPVEIGILPAGYLDVDLPNFKERFAIVFEGQIEITKAGEHQFDISADEKARLFIDGKQVAQAEAADWAVEEFEAGVEGRGHAKLKLGLGFHALRIEYFDTGGNTMLNAWMSGPDSPYRSLDGVSKDPGWRRGPGGHAQSTPKQGRLFRKIEIPKQGEIDLEFTSSASPRFVLVLGEDRLDTPSDKSLRVETRDNELVVVQGEVFEPITAIEEGQRNVHLRLAFNSDMGELQVLDANGDVLGTVKGIQVPIGESMIHVRNRGQDLTIQRLRVYRRSNKLARQVVDSGKARVHLIDGRVMYGRLTVAESGTHVVAQDGTRCEVDLDTIDRIASPDAALAVMAKTAEVVYANGAILRGHIERVNLNRVVLRTAFSDAPVTCTLAGASSIQFDPPASEDASPDRKSDRLVYASGRLHGRLLFDLAESLVRWRPEGGVKPVRLADTDGARIERSRRTIAKTASFDERAFPFALHLKNGEIIPCQVSSYDKDSLGFQSPFIEQRMINTAHVKAIEFTRRKSRGPAGTFSRGTNGWLKGILSPEPKTSLDTGSVKLARALTVPRFSRGNPYSHILVARNGDLKRGNLLGMSTQTIQFESNLRKQTFPVDRLTCVVNVSQPAEEPNEPSVPTTKPKGQVRADLADGSILIFAILESRDGKLIGRSALYGDMAIPTDSIQDLSMGGFEKKPLTSLFEEWVVRPAREPAFGDKQEQ